MGVTASADPHCGQIIAQKGGCTAGMLHLGQRHAWAILGQQHWRPVKRAWMDGRESCEYPL